MLKFKWWKLVACVAVLVAGAGRGEAATYKLSDLLAGGWFVSGDTLFSSFHNFSETPGVAVGAENIYLTPIIQPNRNLVDPLNWPLPPGQPDCANPRPTEDGFRISADWDVTQSQSYNLSLNYTVSGMVFPKIWASEIEMTGNALNGQIDVSENVTSGPLTVAMNSVWIHDPGVDNTIDREYLTSSDTGLPICVNTAQVTMGIQLMTQDVVGAQASLEHIDVYYSTVIPEPSTYALLLLGSAGVGLMVRRKRAQVLRMTDR